MCVTAFAANLLNDGPTPRNGNKSDHAHPPIHPTKYTDSLQVGSTYLGTAVKITTAVALLMNAKCQLQYQTVH